MHYINGREAKVGDQIVGKDHQGNVVSGVVIQTNQSDGCNLIVVPISNPQWLTAGKCLHADDALNFAIPTPDLR